MIFIISGLFVAVIGLLTLFYAAAVIFVAIANSRAGNAPGAKTVGSLVWGGLCFLYGAYLVAFSCVLFAP